MIYTGKALRVDKLPSGIARLVFDLLTCAGQAAESSEHSVRTSFSLLECPF